MILYLCGMKRYVDVIVPLPIAGQYTYSLPEEMAGRVCLGCRVVVPFGRKKFYTGLVTRVHEEAPEDSVEGGGTMFWFECEIDQ